MNCLSRFWDRIATVIPVALVGLTLVGLGGCSTASLVFSATGVATDTSMTWAIVKHLHGKLTEGDPRPCLQLDSVEGALSPRCGDFAAGSIRTADLAADTLDECPLTTAARDPRLWPVLPELLDKGARTDRCGQSPIAVLAQANDCPAAQALSNGVGAAMVRLAETDPREVQHDAVRWLSCPASRAVGVDAVLSTWLENGTLDRGRLSFSPLAALHPSALGTPFSDALEARGHTARDGLGSYLGTRNTSFDEALRNSDLAALDWWLARLPELAVHVPPQQSNQLAWLPLDRVLAPNYLKDPATRGDVVAFLMSRGADPWQHLPADPSMSVVAKARAQNSPFAELLETAAPVTSSASPAWMPNPAGNLRALKLAGP